MRLVKPLKRDARERLASISHHFLSEPQRDEEAGVRAFGFTVIDRTPSESGFPLFGLCQYLMAQGVSSAIFDGDRAISFISKANVPHCITVHDGLHPCALEEVTQRDENTGHEAYFIRSSDQFDDRGLKTDTALLVLPVTAAGSLETQQVMEEMGSANPDMRIAVIITGVPNRRFAELVTNRMAAKLEDSAGVKISAYGYLSQHTIDDPCRVHNAELETIINNIRDDIREHARKI